MTNGQIQIIPLDKIKADNLVRSGEYDEQELIGLALTMREVGQLFPIRVRPNSFAIVMLRPSGATRILVGAPSWYQRPSRPAAEPPEG
jgi:hypothetical protein